MTLYLLKIVALKKGFSDEERESAMMYIDHLAGFARVGAAKALNENRKCLISHLAVSLLIWASFTQRMPAIPFKVP